ncbi:MAG: GTPase Der [Actinomycetota bacterium]
MATEEDITKSLLIESQIWITEDINDDQVVEELEKKYSFDEDFNDEEEVLPHKNRPRVVVIGRPNVGKSTLVNRLIGRREAVVQDTPGVTRDRIQYDAEWSGKHFILIDTGGWSSEKAGLFPKISEQVQIAIDQADLILFIVDAQVGLTEDDEAVVKLIRRNSVPVILVANKVDGIEAEAQIGNLWSLGLGEPFPVSALHGRGSGDLLELVVSRMPDESRIQDQLKGPTKVALIGRPNVGKSSLLNKLTKSNRSVVSEIAGTTVDPVDEIVMINDEAWNFIDTAGIRRRVRESSGYEYYASLRTQAALERAEIALLILESSENITDQDRKLINLVTEAGRALVLVFNKWDLLDEDRREMLEKEIDLDLHNVRWAPRVNLSALTGWHVDRISTALHTAYAGWSTRIATSKLNQFIKEFIAANPHPVRGGKQSKILFATQIGQKPPAFALFTTGMIDESYTRFIERRLREEYGFLGSPIHIKVKIRERRKR